MTMANLMSFNPRAREGRDIKAYIESEGDIEVSIHAPVKGATYMSVAVAI